MPKINEPENAGQKILHEAIDEVLLHVSHRPDRHDLYILLLQYAQEMFGSSREEKTNYTFHIEVLLDRLGVSDPTEKERLLKTYYSEV